MKVVVVGSGGREHALQSVLSRTAEVTVTPGRPGIPGSVKTDPADLDADLFVIGPEIPLVDGVADRLRAQGKLVLGPGADGAQLEGSKIWMKELLVAAGVPTAEFKSFLPGMELEATRYLTGYLPPPWAIKTDYLAAGKGSFVTDNLEQAVADARTKLQKGGIVIEQGLMGPEVSFFALCSGTDWSLLPAARDYKRLLEGDKGPNTGGMGAFSPVPDRPSVGVLAPILDATLAELVRRQIDYRGVLYGGLILTAEGPMMLEYNIRLGDPETQVILPRLQGDVAEILALTAAGETLSSGTLATDACVTVVLASEGYPDSPKTGDAITGIDEANALDGVMVFHAGTTTNDDGDFVTAGGRVLNVTARGRTVELARELAYQAVNLINFRGMQYRSDIASINA